MGMRVRWRRLTCHGHLGEGQHGGGRVGLCRGLGYHVLLLLVFVVVVVALVMVVVVVVVVV